MHTDQLFKQRLAQQWREFLKYLKFIFNDHAVIAFFFLFGALLFAYRQLLISLPVTWWTQASLGLILGFSLAIFNKPATFIRHADALVFLGDEHKLRHAWQQAMTYSMLFNGGLQLIMVLIFWPIAFKLFAQLEWIIIIGTVVLVLAKISITYMRGQRTARFKQQPQLMNWEAIANAEDQRLANIYSFFNLFVDVPGLASPIKAHPYLEKIRPSWPGYHKLALLPLYLTTFIRKSQYLMLWVRMVVLGSLLIPFLQGPLLLLLLALFQYLFVLQLLPLVSSYRRLAYDGILPISLSDRKKAFQALSLPLLLIMDIVWFILIILTQPLHEFQAIMSLTLVMLSLLLVFWYSNYSINSMFKRRTRNASKK
ncbi:ABC-2 type transport system permease protein [Weissella uvarum]|uniref:ABC transporter permease n=1 Tax=Weissella uvarum TaxID=1479233 RepID=UPI00195FE6A5|nr:ABC transporter permease [Weissella uvarum]MBM7617443.1 ABC-2 type transport system permease protein [Weissella uvarum]MCM0595672.1 ABC transporter permease [Weissella uvarum]